MAWFPATEGTYQHVQLIYSCRCYATVADLRHGLATLNSNNFVVYGQKHKVWVLIFVVRTCGAL